MSTLPTEPKQKNVCLSYLEYEVLDFDVKQTVIGGGVISSFTSTPPLLCAFVPASMCFIVCVVATAVLKRPSPLLWIQPHHMWYPQSWNICRL